MDFDINELQEAETLPLESWSEILDSRVNAQRWSLGLHDGAIFPYSPYTGEGVIAQTNTSLLTNNIGYKPTNVKEANLQAAIDHWANGKAPVNARDFINISNGTGVPVDLMLAQAVQESTIGTNGRRPILTKNIFNVGNVDDGGNRIMDTWTQGMSVYANLIRSKYSPDPTNITAESVILPAFVVKNGTGKGKRYASDPNYEVTLMKIIATIRKYLNQ